MKHSTKYHGKNPIPSPPQFGSLKRGGAASVAQPGVANDEMPSPAETAQAAARAAVAISSVDAKSDAPNADPNVTVKAGVHVDPLAGVTSGAQILAATGKAAASRRAR